MELDKIERLLEKYFEGETSLQEENILSEYFVSDKVAPHLVQYRSMFAFFRKEKNVVPQNITFFEKPKKSFAWISVAASVVLALGIGFFMYNQDIKNQDLGTFETPEEAFEATQKALLLVSENVNKGVKSVGYIQEYESTKNLIFN